ncbi:D-ribose pyranase [Mycetocola spongiae]|uniref:D-ribose pyranase n=1 Tax=Mycetocola spongiae TaxID=2859226 RepID=UPI001CF1DB30|nr:D-ribose pyranase [Mycetocola spongiae]UCR88380.1 D-ribose pyranase [Mycetocola spongiae]
MKKTGILNAELLGAIGRLGHTDTFVVADCGLPVPPGVPVIDLAVVAGTPGIFVVLDAILDEVVVEAMLVAEESVGTAFAEGLVSRGAQPATVSHARLKELCGNARFVVRTGEATPYANVILRSGVPF